MALQLMPRILVTGGCGFIGSHASLYLIQKGYEVVILDSHINSTKSSLKNILNIVKSTNSEYLSNIDYFHGDIRDFDFLNNLFLKFKNENKTIDGVIHFAGLKSVFESVNDPLMYWDANVNGTINLLKIMEIYNCETIVFSSSATIYGDNGNLPLTEKTNIRPLNPYGCTKATIENLLQNLFETNLASWRVANLRYFNPIGCHPSGLLGENPLGLPNNIFPLILKVAAKEIKELVVFGNDYDTHDRTCIRDYIHVMDLVEAHILVLDYLLSNDSINMKFNLGTGKGTSVLELIDYFEKANNIEVSYIFGDRRKGDKKILVADNSSFKSFFNWEPRRTITQMCKDGWKWKLRNY